VRLTTELERGRTGKLRCIVSRVQSGWIDAMRCKVVGSIQELDEERWDALAAAEVTMTHRWHRVMETSRVAYQPRYLLAEDKRGPLAAIVAEGLLPPGARLARVHAATADTDRQRAYSSRHTGTSLRPGASPECVEPLLQYLARRERRPLIGVAMSTLPTWPAGESGIFTEGLNRRGWCSTSSHHATKTVPGTLARSGATRATPAYDGEPRTDVTVHRFRWPARGAAEPTLAEVAQRHRSVVFRLTLPVAGRANWTRKRSSCPPLSAVKRGFSCVYARARRCWRSWRPAVRTCLPELAYFVLLDALVRWSLERASGAYTAGLSNEMQKQRHGSASRALVVVRGYPIH